MKPPERSTVFDASRFDDRFARELPADGEKTNIPRQVYRACYSPVAPTAVSAPSLLAHSPALAERIGVSFDDPHAAAAVFSGNRVVEGMRPYAACYGGHQFGHWAGQLGDGRAITLGEVLNDAQERWELQLKGAGPTPYSRSGDGRAVLRSSVREFLCSEAMHHLGIPTTRALSIVTTGDPIMRDMFYDGNARHEPGAIVCRAAPSFLRFGSFELPAIRGDRDTLARLVDHTITHHFPSLDRSSSSVHLEWFEEVCRRTARMIVDWMRVGFVHGVMNTDNMSILGLTIDYGPYGWLEDFDPSWTPNTSDAQERRYRYGNQPHVGLWNVVRLANALYPLVQDAPALERSIEAYVSALNDAQQKTAAQKLGLKALGGEDSEDERLVADLYTLLRSEETDMTLFYRGLADVPTEKNASPQARLAPLSGAYYSEERSDEHTTATLDWLQRYAQRVRQDKTPNAARRAEMNAVNPKFVLRNYLAQLAIDAAEEGDASVLETLHGVLQRPYDEQPEHENYAQKRPEWARSRPGCSMLSCSS